ncbi:S-adenosyl-L-methionine-dependent methyltransferase [Talaromyces proteolyticus]|uniref:S-adenosyl-L-methionine-dependent methyltransferase n=1 Tax=Talaromyces proteolyticus TaxID=1131652 RepID=A0AAD4KMN9_9EURO|nr:S-adenosyl-L-methionine-dependent methyltransferase [Talaromyces proteolyticus]KAH8692725.1 S-adenosyl-L-methionine-dependent methyltransferase [Talaromyces proteolyticus]
MSVLFLPKISCRWRPLSYNTTIITSSRNYAVQAPGKPSLEVFNRVAKHIQKERAARNVEQSRKVDYLKDEVAMRLCDRLLDIKRTFPTALDLGANSCNIARALTAPSFDHDLGPSQSLSDRIGSIKCIETSPELLYRDADLEFNKQLSIEREVIRDLEYLPYVPNTFDIVLSSLSIHWINDLPSLLAQVNSILKPDSPFIAAMFGGDTLFELRSSLQLANMERRGGVIPHISPLADVRDVGGLLTRAGFKMLTVDVEDIVVDFPNTFALMEDLQAMGESNATLQRGPLSKDVLLANEAIYRELHKDAGDGPAHGQGGIPATFRIIFMIGWKEGAGQPQPLQRGSGEVNLKDLLGGGDFEQK